MTLTGGTCCCEALFHGGCPNVWSLFTGRELSGTAFWIQALWCAIQVAKESRGWGVFLTAKMRPFCSLRSIMNRQNFEVDS